MAINQFPAKGSGGPLSEPITFPAQPSGCTSPPHYSSSRISPQSHPKDTPQCKNLPRVHGPSFHIHCPKIGNLQSVRAVRPRAGLIENHAAPNAQDGDVFLQAQEGRFSSGGGGGSPFVRAQPAASRASRTSSRAKPLFFMANSPSCHRQCAGGAERLLIVKI